MIEAVVIVGGWLIARAIYFGYVVVCVCKKRQSISEAIR